MTKEKGWLGPYAPADPTEGVIVRDAAGVVKAIFDEKDSIIKQLREEILELKKQIVGLKEWGEREYYRGDEEARSRNYYVGYEDGRHDERVALKGDE